MKNGLFEENPSLWLRFTLTKIRFLGEKFSLLRKRLNFLEFFRSDEKFLILMRMVTLMKSLRKIFHYVENITVWRFFNMLKIRNFAENSSFWWKWVNYGTIYDWELLKTSSESYVGLLVTYFGFFGDFTTFLGGWVFRKINNKKPSWSWNWVYMPYW